MNRKQAITKGLKRYNAFCKVCKEDTDHLVSNWGCYPCEQRRQQTPKCKKQKLDSGRRRYKVLKDTPAFKKKKAANDKRYIERVKNDPVRLSHSRARSARNARKIRKENPEAARIKSRESHKRERSTPEGRAKHTQRNISSRRKRCAESSVVRAKRLSEVHKRRALVLGQKCSCCTWKDIENHIVSIRTRGLEADHNIPLALAKYNGWSEFHCVSNIRGMSKIRHRRKTSRDIREISRLRRSLENR